MTRSPLSTLLFFIVLPVHQTVIGFSAPLPGSDSNNNSNAGASFTLFDRFRTECPANPHSIQRYDPSLLSVEDDNGSGSSEDPSASVWVAVFRTSNNAPSVFVKDEFLNAMRLATGGITETTTSTSEPNDKIETAASSSRKGFGTAENKMAAAAAAPPNSISAASTAAPVAVARLSPSLDFPGTWTLDNMRCSLKKEDQDDACEGGSEHKEALSVAVDVLLLHYLSSNNGSDNGNLQQQRRRRRQYEGAIRTKATLVGASLVEERGFQRVEALSKDMATHISSLDASMEKYAEKYVESMTTKNQGGRDRAEKILSLLGRMDREADLKAAKEVENSRDSSDDDDYDPWATMKFNL